MPEVGTSAKPVASAPPQSTDAVPGKKPPNNATNKAKPRPPPPSALRRFADGARGLAGRSLRFTGKAAVAVAAVNLAVIYYKSSQVGRFFDVDEDESRRKKRVLVLPLDNLRVVERGSPSADLGRLAGPGGRQPTITVECRELVNAIEEAAADPNITSLFADFGEGVRHPIGHGHLEEIRSAVERFNGRHGEASFGNPVFKMAGATTNTGGAGPKRSYAFGHAFGWADYYLASSFGSVHLQARGTMGLYGACSTNVFLGPMLDKYGIKVHVFRHGLYKNAPSIFTDSKYSSAHLENVKSTTSSIDDTIQAAISSSRDLKFDGVMWKRIKMHGTMSAANSKEIGLIDASPVVNPLSSLLKMTKKEAKLEGEKKKTKPSEDEDEEGEKKSKIRVKAEDKFGREVVDGFVATEAISLSQYKNMLARRERVESRSKGIASRLRTLAERSTATAAILSAFGFDAGGQQKRDKVAVLTIDGAIGSASAYESVRSLREIREDESIKCLVLRVNSPGGSVISSEAIREELLLFKKVCAPCSSLLGWPRVLSDMPSKPIVSSMGNAAASGGYYVSCMAEKIFANRTTLTGSIGVFGVKVDATKWANSYGVRSDYFPHDNHGAAMSPLVPLTKGMSQNFARSVKDFYSYFKEIVADGRRLSAPAVENVAQGRVWTGGQAQAVRLVDELGGLASAIAYARKAHTRSEDVDVEYWPRKSIRLEDFSEMLSRGTSLQDLFCACAPPSLVGRVDEYSSDPLGRFFGDLDLNRVHIMATIDEAAAVNLILRGE